MGVPVLHGSLDVVAPLEGTNVGTWILVGTMVLVSDLPTAVRSILWGDAILKCSTGTSISSNDYSYGERDDWIPLVTRKE